MRYLWPIDAKVLMHKNIAQTYDVPPRHRSIVGTGFGAQASPLVVSRWATA